MLVLSLVSFYTFFLLCFQFDRNYQLLLSFPTRRSSDLISAAAGLAWPRSSPACVQFERCWACLMFMRQRRNIKRSEEHTSELQSLRHLVCRLLLEKKKIIDNKTITIMNSI